ncbi:MAG: 50S ribosomal protein L10 [Chloroflexi bacterium]|nr:50S ribosomal protein L10 [Chloroflexota bacterium]MDE2703212.1 50S ribosomal protein L10 [Chloroflexota bacterium]MDE2862006.1 50S ribosomal protein L10 [Chloroflexota bacterium]MXW29160.1 50S ribosomal protein L10 [Chloroflexota bacterium]MXX99807.1 50S ribosomal protein L10 [Chloroflexota bacterium]
MATRAEKEAEVKALEELLGSSPSWFVSCYRGLSVPEIAQFRSELAEVGASYRVVKNTLVRIAAANQGLGDQSELFDGPIGLAVCPQDPPGAAKVLVRLAGSNEAYAVRGGMLEGDLIDAAVIDRLAAIPSLDELRAQVVGGVAAPLTGLVFTLSAVVGSLVTALEQIHEQRSAA